MPFSSPKVSPYERGCPSLQILKDNPIHCLSNRVQFSCSYILTWTAILVIKMSILPLTLVLRYFWTFIVTEIKKTNHVFYNYDIIQWHVGRLRNINVLEWTKKKKRSLKGVGFILIRLWHQQPINIGVN